VSLVTSHNFPVIEIHSYPYNLSTGTKEDRRFNFRFDKEITYKYVTYK
jgi:hypothetical protein